MSDSLPEPPELDPAKLTAGSFARARKGFEPIEVNKVLGQAADALRTWQLRDRTLVSRIETLEHELSDARKLDEGRIASVLGEETARVISAAREAASEIRAKAEEEAARTVKESEEAAEASSNALRSEAESLRNEAESLRERATREYAAKLEEAQRQHDELLAAAQARHDELIESASQLFEERSAEAERRSADLLEQARTEGREMVVEAKSVRDRILSDLAERRKTARRQIEGAVAGRDRIIAVMRQAGADLTTVVADLESAEDLAREEAGRAAESLRDDTGEFLDSLDIVPLGLQAEQPTKIEPEADPDATDAVAAPQGPADEDVPAPSDDENVTGLADERDHDELEQDELEQDELATAGEPDASAERDALDEAPEPEGEPGGRPGGTGSDAVVDAPSDDALGDAGEPHEDEGAPLPPPESNADSLDREASGPDSSSTDSSNADSSDRAASGPDSSSTDSSNADSSGSESTVVDLFARIRAQGLDEKGEHPSGSDSDDDTDRTSESDENRKADESEGLATGTDGSVITLTTVPTHHEADAVDSDVDGASGERVIDEDSDVAADDLDDLSRASALLDARDELLDPVEKQLLRSLRRLASDEQNEVLDRLRRHKKGRPALDELIPSAEEMLADFGSGIAGDFAAAVEAGFTFWGRVGGISATPLFEVPADAQKRMDALLAGFVSVHRAHLERTMDEAEQAGLDSDGLAQRIKAVYRDWRQGSLGEMSSDLAIAGFTHGERSAAGSGTPWIWVVDNGGLPCADGEDNALAGPVPCDEAFPTGDVTPPAHGGCRCILVPAHH